MNSVLIQTPEGVRFTLPLAGPVSRFLAWAIDEMLVVAATGLVAKALSTAAFLSRDLIAALSVLSYFVIWVGYAIVFEWWWSGQTLGKRALGLRVLDATGRRLEFPQIVLRNLMRFLDAMPLLYLAGGLTMLLNRRYQRLGDIVGNTIVLRRRRSEAPILETVLREEKYNSLLQVPHLAARLRQQVSPELGALAYGALLRRDELQPAARVAVFEALSQEFKRCVRFPDAITDALTDERYVRNAVGVLTPRKIASSGALKQRRESPAMDARQTPSAERQASAES